jgi:hypothetical protein
MKLLAALLALLLIGGTARAQAYDPAAEKQRGTGAISAAICRASSIQT